MTTAKKPSSSTLTSSSTSRPRLLLRKPAQPVILEESRAAAQIWLPEHLKKPSLKTELVIEQPKLELVEKPIRIWSDLDFPRRSIRPFIPKIDNQTDFQKVLKGVPTPERRRRILEALNLTEEQTIPYPSLDPKAPDFEMKFDMDKWLTDPRYVIESFMKIDTKEGGIVDFKLNLIQLAFLFNRTGRDVVLKARQHGITTLILALMLIDTMLHVARRAVIMTHTEEASTDLLDRAKRMYSHLPGIKPPLKRDTRKMIEFEGMQGSQLIIQVLKRSGKSETSRSGGAGRSKTIHFLLLSEPAFYEGVTEKDITGILEAVPAGDKGSVTIESTPNGVGGFFYKTCRAAKRPGTSRKFFQLPWYLNPEYDDGWYKIKRSDPHLSTEDDQGQRLWAQEYECDFLQSGANYFPTRYCVPTAVANTRIPKDPRGHSYPSNVFIYAEPVPGDYYVIGVDPAQGKKEGDFSSVTVISRTTRCEVAQIYGRIKPEPLAKLVWWVARKYNLAFVGVENEKNGMVVITKMMEWGYPNLFRYRNIYSLRAQGEGEAGWSSNAATRPVMLSKLREGLIKDTVHLAFPKRQEELEVFAVIDEKPQAPEGFNDDLVISAAIANRLLDFPEAMQRGEGGINLTTYGS